MKPKAKPRKIRGSTASYRSKNGMNRCDLNELAKKYANYGNVPKTIGDIRAMEISLLAIAYLESVEEK